MSQQFIVNALDENLREVVCTSCGHQTQYDRQELQQLLVTTFLHGKCPSCGGPNYEWTMKQQSNVTVFEFWEKIKSFTQVTLLFVCVIYLYGLLLGGTTLAWNLIQGKGLPTLAFWQYVIAPLTVGLFVFGLEGIGELLGKFFGYFDPPTNRWKRLLGLFLMIVFGSALLLVPILYNIGNS